jgi:hypothetical protein
MNKNNFIKKKANPSYMKSIQESRGLSCYCNLENKSDLPNPPRENWECIE